MLGADVTRLRAPDGHKGTYGHVLTVGGSRTMSGAGLLASRAALRICNPFKQVDISPMCFNVTLPFLTLHLLLARHAITACFGRGCRQYRS